MRILLCATLWLLMALPVSAQQGAPREATKDQRDAAVKAWVDQTARDLSSRFPGLAVAPAGLILPDPDWPRLRPFKALPEGREFGIVAGGLLYGAGQEDYGSQGPEGQFSRLDLVTGELKPLGIGRVVDVYPLKLPDGRSAMCAIEHNRSGTYVVHVLDLQGQPLVPPVDTGIEVYVEDYESDRLPQRRDIHGALAWVEHRGVLYLWAAFHLEVGKIRSNQPLDRKPLDAVSIDLGTGRLLQRRSFAQSEALLIRAPAGEEPEARARVYVASRSPATLTALDWETGSTVWAVPIVTPNVSRLRSRPPERFASIRFLESQWHTPDRREAHPVNPERLGVVVYYPGKTPYSSDSAYFQSRDGAALGAVIPDPMLTKPAPSGARVPSMSLKDERPNESGNDVAVFARDGRRLADGFRSGAVLADDLVQVSNDDESIELIDDTGRRVPLARQGATLTRIDAQHFISGAYTVQDASGRYGRQRTLYRMNDPLPADIQALIKAMPKDEYETMADYGRRLSQTVVSADGEVELAGYDAETQLQRLKLGEFSYEASLPIESARLFRGMKSAQIAGKLRAVAPDVLEFFDMMLAAEGVKAVPLTGLRLVPPMPGPASAVAGQVGATPAAASQGGAGCPGDLSHLARRLPPFGLPELDGVRGEILRTSIPTTIANARAQGYSAEAAIGASLAQADEYDRGARSALETAASADGFGTSAQQFAEQLRAGTLRPADCGNIRNSALCQAILSDMGAVASRAVAEAMQCRQQAGAF